MVVLHTLQKKPASPNCHSLDGLGKGCFLRCSISASTVMMGMPCFSLNSKLSLRRYIVPSSCINSPITPTGRQPAIRQRSYDDSVWPGRSRTPPGLEQSGNIWPGFEKASALLEASQNALAVTALSAADTPVDVPGIKSVET